MPDNLKAVEIKHCQAGSVLSRQDGSVKLSYVTPELRPSEAGALLALHGKNVCLSIVPEDVQAEEVVRVDTERGTEKTPSQRLRGIIFVHFEQEGKPGNDFETFYRQRMSVICDGYKTKNLTE